MPQLDISKIQEYFATQPVVKAWLFGSFARGEQTENSDVDILVVYDGNVGLMKQAHMYCDLKDILNREVDLVPEPNVYPYIRPFIDADKKLIYERNY